MLASAVYVHQVKARNVVSVHLVVVADVSYPCAVRRYLRIAVRPFAVRESFDFQRSEIDRVNLAVIAQVFGLGFADAGDVYRLAVSRPVETALVSAVIVLASGNLERGAAQRRVDDEDMRVASGHGAAAVRSPRQAVDNHRGSGPFGAARTFG